MTSELDDLRSEVMALRADLGKLRRWRDTLEEGTGAIKVRAVTVCDPRGVERVLIGCPEQHDTPSEAGECADNFGIDLRTGLGRSGFDVSTDDEQPSVQLWGEGNVAVSIGRDGLTVFGPDEQPITGDRPEAADTTTATRRIAKDFAHMAAVRRDLAAQVLAETVETETMAHDPGLAECERRVARAKSAERRATADLLMAEADSLEQDAQWLRRHPEVRKSEGDDN